MPKPTILYFYAERPTDEDRQIAAAAGAKLRNVCAYRPGDCLEPCDGVMGLAPAVYVERFGRIEPEGQKTTPAVVVEAPAAPGKAYALHNGQGKWKVIGADGATVEEGVSRATAYRRVRELNSEA
jgi:hypothetical protein